MKNWKLSALLVATMVSAMVAVPAFASEVEEVREPTVVSSEGVKPFSLDIDGGYYVGERGLNTTISLNRSNGKYVNLYVENTGAVTVVATINGQKERRFDPGEKGHIYFNVTQDIFGNDRKYTFVVSPVSGIAEFRWDIAQRDAQ